MRRTILRSFSYITWQTLKPPPTFFCKRIKINQFLITAGKNKLFSIRKKNKNGGGGSVVAKHYCMKNHPVLSSDRKTQKTPYWYDMFKQAYWQKNGQKDYQTLVKVPELISMHSPPPGGPASAKLDRPRDCLCPLLKLPDKIFILLFIVDIFKIQIIDRY